MDANEAPRVTTLRRAVRWGLAGGVVAAGLSVVFSRTPGPLALLFALAAGAGALAFRFAGRPRPAAALALLTLTLGLAELPFLPWPAPLAVASLGLALLARLDPGLRPSWARVLARGPVPLAPTALVAGVTPFALAAWYFGMRPDLGDLDRMVPDLPVPLLFLGAVLFAVTNATLEELLWRGVLMDALDSVAPRRGRALYVVGLSALSMGLMHAWGFPRGPLGVAMVTVWAAMLGWLRLRTRGLAAPIVAHTVADSVIAALLIGAARGYW